MSCPGLRILTWNILSGNPFSKEGLEHINVLRKAAKDIDIVLLQEMKIPEESQEWKEFKRRLGGFYWAHSCNRLKGKRIKRGCAVGVRKAKCKGLRTLAKDDFGRGIVIETEIEGHALEIASLYIPQEERRSFWQEFKYPGRPTTKIIGGDFNVAIDPEKMDDFNAMMKWMEDHEMHLCPNSTPTHGRGNVIDYIFVSSAYVESNITTAVIAGTSLDHNILFAQLNPKTPTVNRTLPEEICKSQVFVQEILNQIGPYHGKEPWEYLKKFKNTAWKLRNANAFTFPDEKKTRTIQKLMTARRYNPFKELPTDDITLERLRGEFINIMKEARKRNKKKNPRKLWKSMIMEEIRIIGELWGTRVDHLLPRKPINLKKIREGKEDVILDEQGGIANDENKKRILQNFWEGVLGKERSYDQEALAQLLEGHPQVTPTSAFKLDMETLEKLFLRRKKSGPGPDGIPFILHQTAFSRMKDVWHDIINGMAQGDAKFDDDFYASTLHLIPKGKGTLTPAQYRPISITNTDYRLIMRYWAHIMKGCINDIICKGQKALLQGRTIDECLMDAGDDYLDKVFHGKKVWFLQTDFTKAFDYINREAIRKTFHALRFPAYILNMLEHLIKNSVTTIAGDKKGFWSKTGVRQGCPCSPLVYIVIANLLVRKLEGIEGASTVRAYMDDNGITIDSAEAMSPIKNWITLYAAATSAELNVSKSKITTEEPERTFQGWEGVITGKGTEYLGLWLSNCYEPKKVWMAPIVKMTANSSRIKSLKCSLEEKIRLINTHIASLFEYVGRFSIVPNSISQMYFKAVRNALGVHGSLPIASIINPFSAFATRPNIIHVQLKSIANILGRGPPPQSSVTPSSPNSAKGHYWQALGILEKMIGGKDPTEHTSLFRDREEFQKWKSNFNQNKGSLRSFIYKYMLFKGERYAPNTLIQEVNTRGDIKKTAFHLTTAAVTNWARNRYITLLHKKSIIRFQTYTTCPLCKAPTLSHSHIIRDCPTVNEKVTNKIAPVLGFLPSSMDLLLADRDLTPPQVNIIINAMATVIQHIHDQGNGKGLGETIEGVIQGERKKRKVRKEAKQRDPPPKAPTRHYTYSDGSYRPFPALTGFGAVLYEEGQEIAATAGNAPLMSISYGELKGLIMGLRLAQKHGIQQVTSYVDSTFIVAMGQPNGVCTVPHLLDLFWTLRKEMKNFQSFHIFHCPREYNERADVLAYAATCNPDALPELLKSKDTKRPHAIALPISTKMLHNYSTKRVALSHIQSDAPQIPSSKEFAYPYAGPSYKGGSGPTPKLCKVKKAGGGYNRLSKEEYFRAFEEKHPLTYDMNRMVNRMRLEGIEDKGRKRTWTFMDETKGEPEPVSRKKRKTEWIFINK